MTEQSRMDDAVSHTETVDDPIEELARIVAADKDSLANHPRAARAAQPAAPSLEGPGLSDPAELDLEAELIAELGGAAPAGPAQPLGSDYPSMLPGSAGGQLAEAPQNSTAPQPAPSGAEPSLEEMLLAELQDDTPAPVEEAVVAPAPAQNPVPANVAPAPSEASEAPAATDAEMASALFPDTGFNEPDLPPETLSGQTATLDEPVGNTIAEEPAAAAPEAATNLEESLDEGFAEIFAEELLALNEAAEEPATAMPQQSAPIDPAPQYALEPEQPQIDPEFQVHASDEHSPQPEWGTVEPQPVHDPVAPAEPPQQAASPAADLDLDFGAAFDMQVQHMQGDAPADPAPAHDPAVAGYGHDEGLAGNYGNEEQFSAPHDIHADGAQGTAGVRDIENQFAAAFADELDFAGAPAQPAHQPAAQHQQASTLYGEGWQHDETGTAEQDFDALAAPVPAGISHAPGDPYHEQGYHDGAISEPAQGEIAAAAAGAEDGKGFNKGFRFAAGALGLALIVGVSAIGYSFYSGGGRQGEPVVVKADSDPVKIKPEDPGGTQIANQDRASYQRVAGQEANDSGQERLVSDTEEPVNVAALRQPGAGANADSGDAPKAEARLTPQSSGPQVLDSGQLQPRRVRTLAVKPDGSVVASAQPSATLAPAANEQAAAIENRIGEASGLTGQRAATEIPPAAQPPSIDGARSTGQLAVPSPRPRDTAPQANVANGQQDSQAPIALAPTPQQPQAAQAVQSATNAAQSTANANTARLSTPVTAGNWAVQLSSQRSAEEAQSSFQRLRARHPSILDNRQMSVQRAEIEDRGIFFRLRVLADTRNEAIDLCERLKAAGESCFVTQ